MTDLSPYVPAPEEIMPKFLKFMAETMQIKGDGSDDVRKHVILEIGCGDARLLIEMFESEWGTAISHALGLDIDPDVLSRAHTRLNGASARTQAAIKLHLQDAMMPEDGTATMRWSEATCCVLYITRGGLKKLWPVLNDRLKPGTPIVTLQFPITGACFEAKSRFFATRLDAPDGEEASVPFQLFRYRLPGDPRIVRLEVESTIVTEQLAGSASAAPSTSNLVIHYDIKAKTPAAAAAAEDRDFIAVYDYSASSLYPDVDEHSDFSFLEEKEEGDESGGSYYKSKGSIDMKATNRKVLEVRFVNEAGLTLGKTRPFCIDSGGCLKFEFECDDGHADSLAAPPPPLPQQAPPPPLPQQPTTTTTTTTTQQQQPAAMAPMIPSLPPPPPLPPPQTGPQT